MLHSLVRVSRRDKRDSIHDRHSTMSSSHNQLPTTSASSINTSLEQRTNTRRQQLPFAYLSTISSTISLFFQSTFHLSLTVLLRYRSLIHIQPLVRFTTNFELLAQTTRLQQVIFHSIANYFITGFSPSMTSFSKEITLIYNIII